MAALAGVRRSGRCGGPKATGSSATGRGGRCVAHRGLGVG
jgi:hypothetical protein